MRDIESGNAWKCPHRRTIVNGYSSSNRYTKKRLLKWGEQHKNAESILWQKTFIELDYK